MGAMVPANEMFVTGAGAGTTYPDFKPAPFIVSSRIDGIDIVTVVTEAIYSYCTLRAAWTETVDGQYHRRASRVLCAR